MTHRGTRYYASWCGRTREIEIRSLPDGRVEVRVDGVPHPADVTSVEGSDLLNLLVDGRSVTYAVRFEDGAAVLGFHDREVRVPIEDERGRLARLAVGGGRRDPRAAEIRSVMPGIVKEVRVAAGESVESGQPLLILEAMKMENEIRSPRAGTVAALHVVAGQAVEKGARLVSLQDA